MNDLLGILKDARKHLMKGVSHMIPFVVAGGVLFAAAAGGRRGSGGSVVAGPAGPHRSLAAGPYL